MKPKLQLDPAHIVAAILVILPFFQPLLGMVPQSDLALIVTILGDVSQVVGVLTALVKASIVPSVNAKAAVKSALVAPISLVLAAWFVLTMAISGCSLFKSGATSTTIVNSVGSLASCVIDHVETDPDPTFETIAEECAPIAITDVTLIVAALATTPDAGSAAGHPGGLAIRVHHRGAP